MLEGEIGEIQLVERFVELWRERFTGAIRFESDGIIKIVYFKDGDILSASTNDRADAIDEILMRAGKVTREHVKQALAKRKESETLGDALLNLGFITRKELSWARRVQVVGVIRSIAAWATGSFTIVADYLPKRDEGTLFPLPTIIVELIVTDQDRQRFERMMEGGAAVYERAADFDDVFRRLGLNEDADSIASQIDGRRSVADVATASGKDAFNVYKLVAAMATLGIVRRAAEPQASPQLSLDDFASAGVADAADLWDAPAPVVEQPVVPVQPAPPMFELDEEEAVRQPTLELALPAIEPQSDSFSMSFDTDDVPPATPDYGAPEPQWSEPPAAEEEPAAASSLPAWDEPAAPPAAPIPPPVVAPPAPKRAPREEQWGFDEAQIETARRASAGSPDLAAPVAPVLTGGSRREPLRRPQPRKSRYGLIVTLLTLVIVGGLGYFGYLWWQDQQSGPAAPVAARRTQPRKVQPRPAAAAPTATIVDASGVATTTTAAPVLTETATSTVAPADTTTATLPPVTASTPAVVTPAPVAAAPAQGGALRERYDAMARQYASNATGNFTVQIQILCDPANVAKAVSDGGSSVWFVPQPISGRSCYRVFWGRFGTRDEAQSAMGSIPASLRDRSAAVKPVPKP